MLILQHISATVIKISFLLAKMALKRAANCTSSSANVDVCAAEESLEEELKLNQYSINYRFNSNKHTTMFLFVTGFPGFYCTNMGSLVCNLGLFKITD